MTQAISMTTMQEGEISSWGLSLSGNKPSDDSTDEELQAGKVSQEKFWDILSKNIKIISRCKRSEKECKKYDRRSLDGTSFGTFTPIVILADGSYIVGTTVLSPTCTIQAANNNVCGEIFVDLNGPKLPNKTGVDVFIFYYTNSSIFPMGSAEDLKRTFKDYCNVSKKDSLNGYGCSAWVIYNENMDYLHCNDLSWEDKTKCQ